MRVALVLTVGTTLDPIIKAIRELHREYPPEKLSEPAIVILTYGRAFQQQKSPEPFEIAAQAKQLAERLGMRVHPREIPDPENIEEIIHILSRIFEEISEMDRVIVNFTGGTKAMSAAAVYAALNAPLQGELFLDYIGGIVRDEAGRVTSGFMHVSRTSWVQEIVSRVIRNLQCSAYRDARSLASRLPETGRAGFVRKATEMLYLWDEFDYDLAWQTLRRIYAPAKMLKDDPQVGDIARWVVRLMEPGKQLRKLTEDLRNMMNGSIPDLTDFELLPADALENGARRIREGRPTDSVLRAYRAVEMAVQGRLLRAGVNPWRPNWDALGDAVRSDYLERIRATQLPRNLALTTGLSLLESMGLVTLNENMQKHLQDLQQTRNLCYLEHGFQRVDEEGAQRVWQYAIELCERILDTSLDEARQAVRHGD